MKLKKWIVKFVALISCILIYESSYSQQNFLPGDVFNLEGDTSHGFIDYRNWGVNPDKISFKYEIDGEELNYTSNEIRGFSVNNEIYISAIVEKETSTLQTDKLTHKPDLNISIDKTFLQTLVQGPKSLYYYKDFNGREYFYIKKGSNFELLGYKKYLKYNETRYVEVVVENKKYYGQLSVYFQNYPSIQVVIRKTKYTKESLLKLFHSYYERTQLKTDFIKKTEKIKADFGAVVGVSVSSLDFTSDYYDYLDKTNYPKSVSPTAGIYSDVILSRNQGKWSLYNEFLISHYNFKGDYYGYVDDNNYEKTQTNLALAYLKMNNMIRFKYPISNKFIFFNVGISNGFVVSEKNVKNSEISEYSVVRLRDGEVIESIRKHEQGWLFGAGVKHKKYSFEIRYETSNGMSGAMLMKTKVSRVCFLLGYRF